MWITYILERAILQRFEKEEDWYQLEEGRWTAPFPNESGNSQAYGLVESFSQTDYGWSLNEEAGSILMIVCTKERPIHFIVDTLWLKQDEPYYPKAILA